MDLDFQDVWGKETPIVEEIFEIPENPRHVWKNKHAQSCKKMVPEVLVKGDLSKTISVADPSCGGALVGIFSLKFRMPKQHTEENKVESALPCCSWSPTESNVWTLVYNL